MVEGKQTLPEKTLTVRKIKRFFDIILFMGIHKLQNHRLYWGKFTHVPVISTTMTRNRFDEILFIIHFNDNAIALPATLPNHSKFQKIQTITNRNWDT